MWVSTRLRIGPLHDRMLGQRFVYGRVVRIRAVVRRRLFGHELVLEHGAVRYIEV